MEGKIYFYKTTIFKEKMKAHLLFYEKNAFCGIRSTPLPKRKMPYFDLDKKTTAPFVDRVYKRFLETLPYCYFKGV